MTNPSLPQNDNPQQQAERTRALAWARTQYSWAHSFTYQVGDGQELVLRPIAVLGVDDQHPLPDSQKLNLIQIFDIVTTVVDLIGNTLVSITNLIDIGAVEFDAPPPASFSVPADNAEREAEENRAEPHKGLLGRVGETIKHAAEDVVDKVKDAVGDVVHTVDDVVEVVHAAKEVDAALDSADTLIRDLKSIVAKLEEQRKAGDALISRAHGALYASDSSGEGFIDELTDGLGAMIENVLKTLLEDAFEALLSAAGLWGPATALRAFAHQFQTVVVPDVVATTMTDTCFARMRVAGPNPLLIKRIDKVPERFPVASERFKALTGQSLPEALSSGRVYLVDYAALENVEPGDFPAGQKFMGAPFALFALSEDRQTLNPVAIQCRQQPGNSNPVFYRDDGTTWELAKLHVQCADGNYHELISHLGLTHLLIEPFAVATHRNLAQTHPLYLLLLPHFQGTLFINNAALTSLIKPGGTVDKLLAGTIESDWKVTTTALGKLDFNTHMLPHDLAARGVGDPAMLPGYPYRDDALLVWNAIADWVTDYVSIYYNSDADVQGDTELQAWYRDLVSVAGGCVKGFGEPGSDGSFGLFTVAYLTEVLTMVIFTSSAQHATVNFPQNYVMSYTPAMPLATYAPPPAKVSGDLPPDTELAHLPPLQMALLQLLVGQLLGGIYFTRLGQYSRHQRKPWFTDPRVADALTVFQNNLASVERTIGARNLERPKYEPLLPSRIPQSINI